MSHLGVALLMVLLVLAGWGISTAGRLHRWTLQFMTGAVIFHLLLASFDFLGIRWSRAALVLPLALAAVLGFRRRQRAERTERTGWGDGAALFALTAFGLFAPTLWVTTPDFVYHWGIKGHRFFLARGVDYEWLARDWNWVLHPDYPNLLPELFAGSALLAGRFEAPSMMLWAVLFFAMTIASGREALRQAGVHGPLAQMGLAVLAFSLAGFAIGQRMAGAADWMPALALVASLPALLRPPDREGDLEVGFAAAFAAASKIEGMPLAVFLAGVQLLRRVLGERRINPVAALRLALPTAAVAILWAARTFVHGLYQKFNTGAFDPGRAPEVLRGLAEVSAWKESWHGLTLLLLLLPLLLLPRRTRPAAAVATLQLLFYLWIYFSAAVDTEYQVISSFQRLAMHLIPAVVVLGTVALGEKAPPPLPGRGDGEAGEGAGG
ncbi:MAG TPA: hypothetical protein VN493_13520 [Thermoanaerobaculia bacterium]|nr:hypothetical protein [Thermoanaerobaculia bacterium]